MKPDAFANSPAGRLARAREGYWAFVPHPLPPVLSYDSALIYLLADAATSLGRLAGASQFLPNFNPYLLIYPHMHREAVLSSRIEGTQASLSDLYLFEATGHRVVRHADVQEVSNYVQALQWGLLRLSSLPLSLRLVRELHARLLQGVRGQEQTPGEFRRSQNWIGPAGCTLSDATYIPPPVVEMMEALSAWEKFLHQSDDLHPLLRVALMHYQFEAIHPFLDGNGRVGRLLITLFLHQKEQLPYPLLYLSAFFDRHRDKYYQHLLAVSQRGAWIEWISFFLRGLREQAHDTLLRSKRILLIQEEYKQRIGTGRGSTLPYKLMLSLFRNPVITGVDAAQRLGVSQPTARSVVATLAAAGILREITGQIRYRVYVANELLALLESEQTAFDAPLTIAQEPDHLSFDLSVDDLLTIEKART